MKTLAALRDPRVLTAIAAAALLFASHRLGLFEFLSIEALREHRDDLTDWVDANTVVAIAAYVAVYVTAVALSIPCGTMLTLSGGFLFGATLGLPLAVVSSTIGAACLFLLVRALVGGGAIDRLGPAAHRLAEGLRRDAPSFLLAMRFAPVFPFFLVNLVPALIGVPLRTYVLTTFVGVIPATTVFAMAGAGLGSVLDNGEAVTARAVLTPEVLAGLGGLAAMALLSIPVRRWAARR
ncbi:MAG: TVP38/TMEM64 family protein, partial [Beijerinckiaceae bacterium]